MESAIVRPCLKPQNCEKFALSKPNISTFYLDVHCAKHGLNQILLKDLSGLEPLNRKF